MITTESSQEQRQLGICTGTITSMNNSHKRWTPGSSTGVDNGASVVDVDAKLKRSQSSEQLGSKRVTGHSPTRDMWVSLQLLNLSSRATRLALESRVQSLQRILRRMEDSAKESPSVSVAPKQPAPPNSTSSSLTSVTTTPPSDHWLKACSSDELVQIVHQQLEGLKSTAYLQKRLRSSALPLSGVCENVNTNHVSTRDASTYVTSPETHSTGTITDLSRKTTVSQCVYAVEKCNVGVSADGNGVKIDVMNYSDFFNTVTHTKRGISVNLTDTKINYVESVEESTSVNGTGINRNAKAVNAAGNSEYTRATPRSSEVIYTGITTGMSNIEVDTVNCSDPISASAAIQNRVPTENNSFNSETMNFSDSVSFQKTTNRGVNVKVCKLKTDVANFSDSILMTRMAEKGVRVDESDYRATSIHFPNFSNDGGPIKRGNGVEIIDCSAYNVRAPEIIGTGESESSLAGTDTDPFEKNSKVSSINLAENRTSLSGSHPATKKTLRSHVNCGENSLNGVNVDVHKNTTDINHATNYAHKNVCGSAVGLDDNNISESATDFAATCINRSKMNLDENRFSTSESNLAKNGVSGSGFDAAINGGVEDIKMKDQPAVQNALLSQVGDTDDNLKNDGTVYIDRMETRATSLCSAVQNINRTSKEVIAESDNEKIVMASFSAIFDKHREVKKQKPSTVKRNQGVCTAFEKPVGEDSTKVDVRHFSDNYSATVSEEFCRLASFVKNDRMRFSAKRISDNAYSMEEKEQNSVLLEAYEEVKASDRNTYSPDQLSTVQTHHNMTEFNQKAVEEANLEFTIKFEVVPYTYKISTSRNVNEEARRGIAVVEKDRAGYFVDSIKQTTEEGQDTEGNKIILDTSLQSCTTTYKPKDMRTVSQKETEEPDSHSFLDGTIDSNYKHTNQDSVKPGVIHHGVRTSATAFSDVLTKSSREHSVKSSPVKSSCERSIRFTIVETSEQAEVANKAKFQELAEGTRGFSDGDAHGPREDGDLRERAEDPNLKVGKTAKKRGRADYILRDTASASHIGVQCNILTNSAVQELGRRKARADLRKKQQKTAGTSKASHDYQRTERQESSYLPNQQAQLSILKQYRQQVKSLKHELHLEKDLHQITKSSLLNLTSDHDAFRQRISSLRRGRNQLGSDRHRESWRRTNDRREESCRWRGSPSFGAWGHTPGPYWHSDLYTSIMSPHGGRSS